MRKLLLLLSLVFCTAIAGAQDENMGKINKIKKNKAFLYGEATMPTREEASSVAMEILQHDIRQWAVSHSKRKVEKVVATDVSHIVDSIITKRVNMFRVFLYVKKSSLIPIFHEEGLVIIDPDACDEKPKAVKEEKKDSMTATAPVADKQSPAKKKKKKKKKTNFLTDATVDERAVAEQNRETTGVMQDELPDTLAADSLQADTLETDTVADAGIDEVLDDVDIAEDDENNPALQKIKALKSFTELRGTLLPMKEQGVIIAYGKYATMKDPEKCYLIIYDPNGHIRAVLGKGSKTRKNLNTSEDDSISNYRGCGAIWVQLK